MNAISHRRGFMRSAAIALTILACASCGGPSMNPAADRARTALEAALNAWRDGKRPGTIEGTNPPVQAIDNDWSNGRKLIAYSIVGDKPSEMDKRFSVKLSFTAPPADVDAVYIIVGASPLSVFREEDYARTLNMDNNPTPPPKKKGRR